MKHDDQGQLSSPFVHIDARFDRSVNELIGISRGVIADGVVNKSEAEYLLSWIKGNLAFAERYPFNILYKRLAEALADGFLDEHEQSDLFDLLYRLTGGESISDEVGSMSTSLPLDDPMPTVEFAGKGFVFTGVFTSGPRKQIEGIVRDLGGVVQKQVSGRTDFLVIGDIASRDWIHSNYGRKIESAANYRDKGAPVAIISESHLMGFLHGV